MSPHGRGTLSLYLLSLSPSQELIAVTSGRIPSRVEKAIRKLMVSYENNLTSVLSQFPSQAIANVIDGHAATLTRRAEKDAFFMNTQGIVELIQKSVQTRALLSSSPA